MQNEIFFDEQGDEQLQILTFTLGEPHGRRAVFGVDVALVREVARAPQITPIPGAAVHVAGMVSLREDLMRVVDLSSALLGQLHCDEEGFLIVTDLQGRQQAFLVSGIQAILRIRRRDIRQIDGFGDRGTGLVAGVVMTANERLVTLLDLSRLQLADDPVTSLAELAALTESVA